MSKSDVSDREIATAQRVIDSPVMRHVQEMSERARREARSVKLIRAVVLDFCVYGGAQKRRGDIIAQMPDVALDPSRRHNLVGVVAPYDSPEAREALADARERASTPTLHFIDNTADRVRGHAWAEHNKKYFKKG